MQDSNIKVSICCAVYNHEKYLRKCLDGFLMQKTNFKYEILIHDDASTDNSVSIIKEYEKKYPDIIKPIYQVENQYSKGKKITWEYQFSRAIGKYIALCEGDDYWVSANKLQLQYDALEKHQDAVMCTHNVSHVSEDEQALNNKSPIYPINKELITSEEMMNIMITHFSCPFQTSSYFFKTEYVKDLAKSAPDFMKIANFGDITLMLYLISKGKYVYLNKDLSCYRVFSSGSWSSKNDNWPSRIRQRKIRIAVYTLYDIYSEGKYSSQINKIIEVQQYSLYQINKEYEKICSRQYRWLFKQEKLKQRIYYLLCAYIPFWENLYNRIKK